MTTLDTTMQQDYSDPQQISGEGIQIFLLQRCRPLLHKLKENSH